MASKVTCSNCGWSWNKSDSSKKDMYVCHQCGRDNSNKSESWLDKYDDGGTMQEHQENYNIYDASAPEGMQGDGFSNVGRDYSPAWGGQFKDGGKANSSTPVIDDAGNYNEKGNWIPDWKTMTAQAKKIGAKKVRTKHGSLIIFNDNWEVVGVDDNPDAMRMGGSLPNAQKGLTFLQPNDYRLPSGIAIPNRADIISSELATSIGGEDGEPAYLIPSFKGGRRVNALEEYKKTGEHLGGPFKTYQEAEEWERDIRHPYVEKGQSIPTPIRSWGKDFQMGGSLPGSVGFTYARTAGSAPANGKYTKKTKASAQNGQEMSYYQHGLDFKTKGMKDGGWLDNYEEEGIVKDDMGYWNPDNHGKVVEIDSNNITMEGVDQPLIGISDEGDKKYMLPGKNYKFKGKKVREYPVAKNGVRQEQKGLLNLDQLTNFTNYNKPQPGGWLNKYN